MLWRLCRWAQETSLVYVNADKAYELCRLLWGSTDCMKFGRVLTVMSRLKWHISQRVPELGAFFEFEEVVLY